MEAEAVQKHYYSQKQKGIHRAVFEIYVFFNFINVADSQFADDESAQAVAQQNKGHRKSKSERAQNSVYGESGVYHFQIKYLGRVGKSFAHQFFFFLLGVLLEAVGDKEGGGADDGAKSHHRIYLKREPDDGGEQDGGDGEKPDPFLVEKFFSPQAVIFRFHKKPMKEKKNHKSSSADKNNRRGHFNGCGYFRVVAESGSESSDKP